MWLSLATVLPSAGRRSEAAEAAATAIGLYEEKGVVSGASEARRFLEEINARVS